MVGVLITLLFAVGAIGVGQLLVGRLTTTSDRAEALGVHGLVGLGSIGLLTLFIGLLPDGLKWGLFVIGAIVLAGYVRLYKSFQNSELKFSTPHGPYLLFPVVIAAGCVFALVGVLAPSDTLDWDTLAYHLAVPKLWLQSGQIHFIPYIHHSNFPDTVDNLYIWGLSWGAQSGAKAFSLAFLILGIIALFGIARSRYGGLAGWWAGLAFATVPVVLWESGTGYIDVAHGLFGGLGIIYAALFIGDDKARPNLWLSALFLGFAAGSKYTGLQTIAVVCLVVFVALALSRATLKGFMWAVLAGLISIAIFGPLIGGVCLLVFVPFSVRGATLEGLKPAAIISLVAMAIAGPWYVKNVVQTGNPVYPFFFERLGGKNWDQKRADVYRDEQQTFGAGTKETRHNPTELGNAILGLAYQPGRYVNPQQEYGGGTPLGAIGIVVIAAALLWAISGKLSLFESSILGIVGISVLMWFFLSQQSRYVVPLCVPLAVLAGGVIERLKARRLLMGLAIAQAGYSLYLVYSQRFDPQSQVALGKITPDEYQSQTIAFYDASLAINKEPAGSKVALYDEVFGFLLDIPYMWANPPHSTIIPYDSTTDYKSYVIEMKKLGFTHVYISTSRAVKNRDFVKKWEAAMGFQIGGTRNSDGSVTLSVMDVPPVPFADAERQSMLANWQDKWMVLLSDAVANKCVTPEQAFKGGVLFKIQ